MIVRMAKVLLTGPKERFLEVLSVVQHLGVMHIDPTTSAPRSGAIDQFLSRLSVEQALVEEGLFLERLRQEIRGLLQHLGAREVRPSFISPKTALTSLPRLVGPHTRRCATWAAEHDRLKERWRALLRYHRLLQAVAEVIPDPVGFSALDVIGVVIADSQAFADLLALIKSERETFLEFKILGAEGQEQIGLLIAELGSLQWLREILEGHGVVELQCPELSLTGLPFPDKRAAIARMTAECEQQLREVDGKLVAFARQWGGIYSSLGQWINERLAMLDAGAAVCETEFSFFLVGWTPMSEVARLERTMDAQFNGTVLVEEMEVFEQDLEKIPISLKNPPYFRPFELFSRILPLPRYSSFDITPYLAIFFPIFFGLMLGDVGYGLVLFCLALLLYYRSQPHGDANDAAKILLVSSGYAMIFGVFYGEFFGEIGHRHFGLPPGLIKRQTAIIPMLLFSISLGVVHVILGLGLGMISAVKRDLKKEALFKLFSILIIVFLATAGALFWRAESAMPIKPLAVTFLVISGVLLFSGGVLAPLEVLKHFGNIISYARIMAIGLTSVLLAEVANEMAGMMGSVWSGLIVAVLLHAFNLLLGLFAPTIHALRLHYVEFFSKFMEEGGRAYKPLGKAPPK